MAGPQNLSTFDASLKDYYEGKIREILNRQVRAMMYMKKGTKPFDGRRVVFPVNVRGTPAVVFMPSGGDLPAPVPQATVDATIYSVEVYGRIQLTHSVMQQAETDRGAFERPLKFEVKRMTKDFIDKQNRSAMGTGTGQIAECETITDATPVAGQMTIIMSNLTHTVGTGINGNAGNRYIKDGDIVDFVTSDGLTIRHQGAVVQSHNISTDSVVLLKGSGSLPVTTDGVYVARPDLANPYNGDPMGWLGIVDDGTYVSTLQGISRTTYPIWKAQALNAGTYTVPGAMTLDLLQRALDAAAEGGGTKPTLLMCHQSTRREVLNLMFTDRRYTSDWQYKAGFKEDHMDEWPWETTVSYDECPIVYERMFPWRTLVAIDGRILRKWEQAPFHWVQSGGSSNSVYLVPGKAGLFEGQCQANYNIGTDEEGPASCTVIRYISVAHIDRVETP